MQSVTEKKLLRFITCGSVDDGKSTLIGRMLYDAKAVYEDQIQDLGEDPDFALLVDGLSAEREQGITIDVAHRYFSTRKREFIVADTPGHEQYTRNMATGASTADLAILIVDAQKGIRPQTRRHSLIVSLLGIRHVVLAINKIDLVNYSQDIFESLEREYEALSAQLGFKFIQAIPLSALKGDNVTQSSAKTPWYGGPSLFDYLENIDIVREEQVTKPFRMPVQMVFRPNAEFRGYAGQIASGAIAVGDDLIILPSGKKTVVKEIVTYDGNLAHAHAGKSVIFSVKDDIDISRGDVLSSPQSPCDVADLFKVTLFWMSEKEMVTGRQYLFRSGTVTGLCTLNELDGHIDVDTFELLASKTIAFNEIGVCNLFLDRQIAYEPYSSNRDLGSFVLIDRVTYETVGMGMIKHALRRSRNVKEQKLTIDKAARSRIKGQTPCVIWMTGISGAGKSTIADILEQRLWAAGKHTIILDGDNIRRGLSRDLGFTEHSRAENVRRAAEVARLMMEAGLVTIVSFISPFRAEREMAKEIIGQEYFIEVFVDTAMEIAEARDVKGLYKKARAGEIPNFTGIGSPYEAPEHPDIHLETSKRDAEAQADIILRYLADHNFA